MAITAAITQGQTMTSTTTTSRRTRGKTGALTPTYNTRRQAWELWHRHGGRRYCERALVGRDGDTPTELRAACQRMRLERIANIEAEAGLDPTSFAAVVADWAATKPAETAAQYRSQIKRILASSLAELTSTKVRPRHVYAYLGDLVAEGMAPNTVDKHRTVLSGVCTWGMFQDRMASNPMDGLPALPKGAGTTKVKKVYTEAEWAVVVEHLVGTELDRDAAIVAVLLFTGMRSGEVRALDWADIDWAGRTLTVDEGVTATNVIGAPKTKSSMRTIGLSAEAVAVLQRWRGDRIPSGLVFPGRSGHGGISHNTVVRATEKVAERIGVKRLEPHEYRATMASVALGRGANRKQVADHLGHANVNELPTYEKRTADLDVERFAGRGVA